MALSICLPRQVVHDNGKEFMGCEFQELLESYSIKSKPTTVKNPTANGIVERIHGTLGEQLRATVFSDDWSNDINTLIQACAFALRAALPARGTYSPAQLCLWLRYDLLSEGINRLGANESTTCETGTREQR
jgi:transposase InsO family protein